MQRSDRLRAILATGADSISTLNRSLLASSAYSATLVGGSCSWPKVLPPNLWPGDPIEGVRILEGERCAAKEAVLLENGGNPWTEASLASPERFHDFGWLRHLSALGTTAARDRARHLIEAWIDAFGHWHPLAWRTDVLAERLFAWLCHADFIAGEDEAWRGRLMKTLLAQQRHLKRCLMIPRAKAMTIRGLKGQIAWAACVTGRDRDISRGLRRLHREVERQILPDGGHIERNPATLAAVLQDVIELKATLQTSRKEVPDWLQGAIDRMVPMMRTLRHGDGGLAVFNGGGEDNSARIDALLALAKVRGKPLTSAPHVGFVRMANGRTTIVVETGGPPPAGADQRAHAGLLSFEMSVGRQRLIVNCGTREDHDPRWEAALRATAAHSTLVIGNVNAVEVKTPGGLGSRPISVTGYRREIDGHLLVDARHDGYRKVFGMDYRRQLFLSREGTDVRGEEEVSGGCYDAVPLAVRFHLHPSVMASLTNEGGGALLKLPNGGGWRFRATGGEVGLEDSVYFGGSNRQRSQQIVVAATAGRGGSRIRWRLSQEA